MRIIFLRLVVFALVGIPRTDAPKAPFSLSVVPSFNYGEGGTIWMAQNTSWGHEFYVVLTYVSSEPQAVWETWNSWGYQTISFEFTGLDGSKILVSKRRGQFTRNGPSIFLIQPGEHQVYAIRLDDKWGTNPVLAENAETPIKVKAVYEASPTPEAIQYKVWTGRLESRSYNFALKQSLNPGRPQRRLDIPSLRDFSE